LPTFGDRGSIATAFDLERVQVALEQLHGLPAKSSLHPPDTAMAEIEAYMAATVVLFLTKFLEKTVNDWRNRALLTANTSVPGLHATCFSAA
jgi:hypothetical protein